MTSSVKGLAQLDPASLAGLRERMRLATDMSVGGHAARPGYSDRAILAGFEAVRPRGDAFAQGWPSSAAAACAGESAQGRNRKLTLYMLDDFLRANECAS